MFPSRLSLRLAFFLAVLLACVGGLTFTGGNIGAQTAAGTSGEVSGHLYCADSQTPCRFASVVIESAPPLKDGKPLASNAPLNSYFSITDIDGSFQVVGVLPGDYYILGKLQGYLSAYDLARSMISSDSGLSAQSLEIALTRIRVEAGRITVVNQTLSRGASLGGTLRFDDGAVAINLPVHLYRRDAGGHWKPYINTAGGTVLAPLGLEQHTNDRGQFYEPGLPPGTYTVEATLPEVTFAPSGITGTPSLNANLASGNALRVYNGDKYRLADATAIQLHEGEQRGEIEVTIPTRGLYSVGGEVTSGTDRRAVTSGRVSLLATEDKTMLRKTEIAKDGSFSFHYVARGTYLVSVEPSVVQNTDKGASALAPLMEPLVVDSDVPDLRYNVSPMK